MARILFVDDDPFTLETLTKAVQIAGHLGIHAGNAHDALSLVTKECPDLIFIDRQLPDMDGLDLIKTLKEQAATSQIPIFMLSAGPEAGIAGLSATAGALAYLNKPIRLQTLLELIQEYTAK